MIIYIVCDITPLWVTWRPLFDQHSILFKESDVRSVIVSLSWVALYDCDLGHLEWGSDKIFGSIFFVSVPTLLIPYMNENEITFC